MFNPSELELQRAKEWMHTHDHAKHAKACKKYGFRYAGAIGGAYTWCFTPTSIGVALTIRCSCGMEENVTDYDSW